MSIVLRNYQAYSYQQVQAQWSAGRRNVLLVDPPGTGKTVQFSHAIAEHDGGLVVAIAHREELIGQMCVTLARYGVPHRVAVSKTTVKRIAAREAREAGTCLLRGDASCIVASVDTLAAAERNRPQLVREMASASLWVVDEAHHVTTSNKWGRAIAMMPLALGLGVTATPRRTDGQGLGRHAGGVFDVMVRGLGYRESITEGWLTDFEIAVPPHQVDMAGASVGSSTGDWSAKQISQAVAAAGIVGDVVEHYQRLAAGRRAICYAPSVAIGTETAARFKQAGIAAEIVSAKTPDSLRASINRRFASGELTVLVNVDLFGEGYDLPAIEVVIMMRPTASLVLFIQQAMRAFRTTLGGDLHPSCPETRKRQIAQSDKPRALIIDHVGNVIRHGLPDKAREWSLDRREGSGRRGPAEAPLLRNCLKPTCMQVYERILTACPYCGQEPEYKERNSPEQVDGDLQLLDIAALEALRRQVYDATKDPEDYKRDLQGKHCPPIGVGANVKKHKARLTTLKQLRLTIDWWAGFCMASGRSEREAQKMFYREYGIDVLSALALSTKEAESLAARISENLISKVRSVN